LVIGASGPEGFSLNGGRRNVGYVGQSMAMSRNGTPFQGEDLPMVLAGSCGTYKRAEPVYNASRAIVLGDQYQICNVSVSTKGMLEKKYKWIHNGQYPNVWITCLWQ
jgi:hypothetical protein